MVNGRLRSSRRRCGGNGGGDMIARFAIVVVTLLAAVTARAEVLSPEAARRFVAGKLFAFNCFDGSRGAGRIYADGSVIGTIQMRGTGPVRAVWLPEARNGTGEGTGGAERLGQPCAASFRVQKMYRGASAGCRCGVA